MLLLIVGKMLVAGTEVEGDPGRGKGEVATHLVAYKRDSSIGVVEM